MKKTKLLSVIISSALLFSTFVLGGLNNINADEVDGKFLQLEPFSDVAGVVPMLNAEFVVGTNVAVRVWRCKTNINFRWVPASCREAV